MQFVLWASFEDYTLAFLDRYLKQRKSELLDVTTKRPAGVVLERFGSRANSF